MHGEWLEPSSIKISKGVDPGGNRLVLETPVRIDVKLNVDTDDYI